MALVHSRCSIKTFSLFSDRSENGLLAGMRREGGEGGPGQEANVSAPKLGEGRARKAQKGDRYAP